MSAEERPPIFYRRRSPPFTFPEIRDHEEEVTGKTHRIHGENALTRISTPEWEWTYRGKATFCGACGLRITDSSTSALRVKMADHRRFHCNGGRNG